MSKEYREIAKKLGVKYLFGRWGISFYSKLPDGKIWDIRLVPLDGWEFKRECIIEALADDPDFKISYTEKSK